MMNKILLAPLAGIALAFAMPASAQSDSAQPSEPGPEQLQEMMGMLGGLFQTEPLTPEQEARLPAANAVVLTMMPEGFYSEMMRDMMDKMMRPMMSMFTAPEFVLGTRLSVDDGGLDALSEAEQVELMAMLDPAYDRRTDVIIDVLTGNMGEMFAVMEPPMREGLSKAYAVRFDEAQLADIASFFATPTGSIYAKESMALFADPQVMQSTMQALPAMMGSFGDMESAMKQAMESLPAERGYEDMSDAERARMAELLDVDAERLESVVVPPKPMEDGAGSQDRVDNLLLAEPEA